jgi:hypothetical protein
VHPHLLVIGLSEVGVQALEGVYPRKLHLGQLLTPSSHVIINEVSSICFQKKFFFHNVQQTFLFIYFFLSFSIHWK